MPDHLRLDINLNKVLSVVDRNATTDELRKDRDITAVGSNRVGARASDTFDEMLILYREASAKTAAYAGRKETDDEIVFVAFWPERHCVELFHVETTVGEFLLHTGRGC
jgi:hypothetical protein